MRIAIAMVEVVDIQVLRVAERQRGSFVYGRTQQGGVPSNSWFQFVDASGSRTLGELNLAYANMNGVHVCKCAGCV